MSNSKFLLPYGKHPACSNDFDKSMDTTDQRAVINNVEELWNQFVADPEVMSELDAENIADFDNDVYEYLDRSEYGEDIALMAEREIADAAALSAKQKSKPDASRKRSERS